MSDPARERRVRALEEAIDAPAEELASVSSNASVRNSPGPGLSMLPYLTINDITALREAGFEELEDLCARTLEVPETAWEHVLDLVRADIVAPDPDALQLSAASEEA